MGDLPIFFCFLFCKWGDIMGLTKTLDTSNLFSGGSGMFIEYHDIIKPAKLYAICKMIIMKQYYGLPFNIIKDFSILSIIEWYINRRYVNPLKQLDFADRLDNQELDNLLAYILKSDSSIYTLSPRLNLCRLFDVYNKQHMIFPVFIYSKIEEPGIEEDCKDLLLGIDFKYVYGDLKNAISKCDENFTYIFSDIEEVNSAANILKGTYSHILLASDYRYNYKGDHFKYNLKSLMLNNPVVRLGTVNAFDIDKISNDFLNII